MRVALATCVDLPEPDPDAAPLSHELAAEKLAANLLAWDDPRADWTPYRMTVLRSTWNYPLQPAAFLDWAERTAAVSSLWNPLATVRWNLHKGYLLDLERRGIPIVPTTLLRQGTQTELRSVMEARGWDTAVVKPAVSAASYKTMRVDREHVEAGEAHFRELLAERDVLVQDYLPSVEGHGERALVWIDGELTHAVRKSPRFEGQDEAVSPEAVPIAAAERSLAGDTIDAVERDLLYARVDVAPGPDGRPVVMELELIEPSLFFPQSPQALARFVAGIRRRLGD